VSPRAPCLATALAVVLAACGTTTTQDALYPACNDSPTEGLVSESTSGGKCPTHPTMLVGQGTVGSPCTQAADCAPICCECSDGQAAAVSQCAHGSCLDGTDTCCLYSLQCAN
jgi:hypothetical protein